MHSHLFDFLTLYGVFIVGEMLLLLTLLHMLYQRRSPTSLISWLLFMIVMPYLSVMLYFIIGRRKQTESKCKKYLEIKSSGHESTIEVNSIDGILRANGITGVSENNSFELITDNVKAFQALLQEIQNANSSISISTYVFKNDAMTKQLLAAMTDKALQGVQVPISSIFFRVHSKNCVRPVERSIFLCHYSGCPTAITSTCVTTERYICLMSKPC